MSTTNCRDVAPLLALESLGESSPADAAVVEGHLDRCASCRRHAAALFRQDRALTEMAAESGLAAALAERIHERLQREPNVMLETPRAAGTPRRTAVWWAMAASLIAAFSVWGIVRQRHAELVVAGATVESAGGRVLLAGDETRPLVIDDRVPSGAMLRTVGDESFVALRCPDGTRLDVGADTELTLTAATSTAGMRVDVKEGFLTADVAKQPPGRPMLLATPQAELVVLGTKFQLSGGSQATYVETTEGAVRVVRKSDGQALTLTDGFETSVTAAGPFAAQALPGHSGTAQVELHGFGPCCWTGPSTFIVAPFLAGDVRSWEVFGGRVSQFAAHRKRTVVVASSPDGETWATAGLDGKVKLWRRSNNALQAEIDVGFLWIADLSFSADGRSLAVLAGDEGDEDRTVQVWDVATRTQRFAPFTTGVQRWAFAPDGRRLAVYDRRTKLVRLWNLADGRLLAEYRTPVGNNFFSLAFSHDGKSLAFDGSSGLVVVCEPTTGRIQKSIERRGGRIFGMTFSPDDETLATGHQDGSVRLWNTTTGSLAAVTSGRPATHARAVSFSGDGRFLLTQDIRLATDVVRRDFVVGVWDVASPSEKRP